MINSLEGKIALVTGGSRGIGRAICLELASQGAKVIVNYNGSKEKADEVVREIESAGGYAESYGCNVADFEQCLVMTSDLIERYGRVDILVNNAGITKDNIIMRMSEADFDEVIDVNLKGAFNTIRHLSRYFLKNKSGKIINIASVSGVLGNAGQSNYSASKAGIIGLTKSVARELASRNICVNAVAPGFIETEMTSKMPESVLESAAKNIPLGRIGQPQNIADMVAYLASSKADYITGQIICVDGGMAI